MPPDSILSRFGELINSQIAPNIFMATAKGVGEKVLDADLAKSIYGEPEDFISSYKEFQKKYFEILSDPNNIRRSFSRRIDTNLMQKSGMIDFSVLNQQAKNEMESFFSGKVLKLDTLLSNVGFPTHEFPSSSPFRTPFKFEVEQGLEHPAQVMLNRMIFNIDPTSSSIADIRFGTQNISSIEDIERNLFQIKKMGDRDANGISKLLDFSPDANGNAKKVVTFDIETTGLGSSSQLRSIALTERTSLDEMPKTVQKFGYDSPRLGGILAGADLSDTLSDFISRGEQVGSTVKTEENFLSNMKNVMKKLNEADQVTGHNVNFDINQMFRTMMGMKGYHADKELVGLVDDFLEKKQNNKMFLIDTLEIGRAYITEKAEALVKGETNLEQRGKDYMKKFFSAESLAESHMGGRSTYVGVENFAMNTNLLELMAEETGHAPEIFKKIFQGSHIAETDTILQDHILKYIHTNKLDFRDASKVIAPETAEMINLARKTIFKSKAITPVTNIADPRQLTETALSYVKEEGITGVRATISLDMAEQKGLFKNVPNLLEERQANISEGFIKFEKGQFRLFTGMSQEGIELDRNKAKSHLQQLIQSATEGDDATITVFGEKYGYRSAEKQIISLGVNVEQNSAIGIMQRAMQFADGPINPEQYVENVGNLYENFADQPTSLQIRNITKGIRTADGLDSAKMNFSAGMNSSTEPAADVLGKFLSHAQSSLQSGNKYGFLGPKLNVLSTMLASETSALATKAYQAAMDPGIDDISRQDIQRRFAYAATEEIADVTSQFGISNFRKQSTTRLSGNEGQAKKLLLSYDYFKQLNTLDSSGATVQMAQQIENQKVSLSLSVADRVQNGQSFQTINMVWKQGRDASNLTAKSIAEQLFDDFISSDNYKNIDSANVAELDQQAANIRTTYGTSSMSKLQIEGQKDEIVQKITQSIDERGIGIASLGENTKEEQRLVSNVIEYFNKSGVDILTENIENIQADIIGESDDIVQMGHLYDPTVIEAGGDAAKKRLAQANLTAIDDASTIGKALSSDPNLLRTAQSRLKAGRRQTPISTAVENYHKFKGPAGVAALGLTALAAGYYIGRKKQETDLYDETLEEQPTQSFRQNNLQNNYTSSITSLNSSRRDPLVTAGVVGNLDRKKIGHTQMGNNKNNHLYGR